MDELVNRHNMPHCYDQNPLIVVNVFKVALTQKHIGLIKKQQSLSVFSKLKDERKLPLKLL